jgi:transcriptional regulator with XRE-family HTH domain
MTTDELTAALKEDKTLKQLAEEKGVDFADVQAAIQAVRGEERFGRGLPGGPGLEAAAQALGMTADELTAALKEGKTLEQLAEEKGVDIAEGQAALQAERETEMRERIQQALDAGTITQEHADWLLEGLDKGFLGKPGGFGIGFDGPQGPVPADGAQPTQEGGQ